MSFLKMSTVLILPESKQGMPNISNLTLFSLHLVNDWELLHAVAGEV